ncbi:hypothetical protein GCK72_004015 [Caenorhabditis remanei]|uniref:Uncharacterized protein n=1 Tax=Caenorhabditis remanei TaxID=31234 RepID=A0A6A5HAI0_CAERE|nr:hypothetical protein GCK72_004015 [Caenorhabditis remanei]KAF1764069.1 hypothetical protein GCK72_004015 [Caenorhabditis remanei]
MEPNLRIQLSLHSPAIRFAEKATPMKIDNLQLDRTMIKINNTQYKLGVIRIYNGDDKPHVTDRLNWIRCLEHREPDQVEQDNTAGGLTYDLNEYGSRDYSCEYVLLPGDIIIDQDREGDERSRVGELQYRRIILRGAMIRQGLEQDPENPLAVQNDEVYAQDCRIIESNQWSVLPHQLQEDGGVYPFENYLQLTIGTEGSESSKRIKRVIYAKKIPEAMKHLLTMILGNRKKNLDVENFKCADRGILRVPQGLKLTIRKILVGNNLVKTLDALQPVMGSTFDTIEMTDREYTLEDIQHPAIKNAKKVILTCWCQGVDFMLDTLAARNEKL